MKEYDVVIVGGGPAGLAAGIYGARAKMNVVILEKAKLGGQIIATAEIANYPGGVDEESGPSLIARMEKQARDFGADIEKAEVESVDFSGDMKVVKCKGGEEYHAKAVILAPGASPRKIGCPGEGPFTGKGVSYCATCDGDFFTDLEIFVVGGGDTALEEGMYLTKFGRKVSIIHRRDEFRAAQSIIEKAKANPKMEFIYNATVEEIKGDGIVESIVLKDTKTGELREIKADEDDGTFGIFVFIGFLPFTEVFKGAVEMDQTGYIKTDEMMKTNVEGVFAAGDARVKTLRQVVTASSDGAIAAMEAEKYIAAKFENKVEPPRIR